MGKQWVQGGNVILRNKEVKLRQEKSELSEEKIILPKLNVGENNSNFISVIHNHLNWIESNSTLWLSFALPFTHLFLPLFKCPLPVWGFLQNESKTIILKKFNSFLHRRGIHRRGIHIMPTFISTYKFSSTVSLSESQHLSVNHIPLDLLLSAMIFPSATFIVLK